jgi:hypothetical protein
MAESLFQDIADYIRLSKDALDLARGAWTLLPKGEKRDEGERRLHAAEEALKRSDAALAHTLRYNLCQCEFPPRIMLWREHEKVFKCPSESCGRIIKSHNRPLDYQPEYF